MANLVDLQASKAVLRELAQIVDATRQTLAAMIRDSTQSVRRQTRHQAGQLTGTLEHLEHVREGFILSQRMTPTIDFSELRAMVRYILMDWDWLEALNLTLTPHDQIEPLGEQLMVYNHATIAMAVLPRLPAEAITFPQLRPSYQDVSVPAMPGELLARIEELEQMIYQADLRPVNTLDYAPFRRTYAFFEASSWLINRYLNPLLGELPD
jgi:hypothetical protein